jgi:hypothetical protein
LKLKARHVVFGVVVTVLIGFLLNSAVNRTQCWYYGYSLERDTQYRPFIGCTVKTANGWVPRGELRTVQ